MPDMPKEWQDKPLNPEYSDLYDHDISVALLEAKDGERWLGIPKDEDLLEEEAFFVAEEDDLCYLGEYE